MQGQKFSGSSERSVENFTAVMLRLEEDPLPADLHPDTCQQLFDLCQRRCRTEAHIGDPGGRSLAIKVSNGRLRLTNADETTMKL